MALPGTAKFCDPARRFGFVVPDDGNRKVFVHASVLHRSGLADLQQEQRVPVPILAPPAEDQVRVHVMPARHRRHRNPGLVALRNDQALPRFAPPTATAAPSTVDPGTRLLGCVRDPHSLPGMGWEANRIPADRRVRSGL